MKTVQSFSWYTKSLLIYNLAILLLFSALYFDIWGYVFPPYFDSFLLLEIFVVISTVALYFSWLNELGRRISTFRLFLPTLIFMSLFLFGIGQHSSANQIHVFVQHPSVMLFDEYLSHWTFITAICLIGISFIHLELFTQKSSKNISTWEKIALGLSGMLQGSIIGIYSIEGRSAPIIGTLSLIGLLLTKKWLRKRLLNYFPISFYYSVVSVAVVATLIGWISIYRGLFEPSASGFGRF